MKIERKYAKDITCPICGKPMELEDIDCNFQGNQDEYYGCEDCMTSAFITVRYGTVRKIEFRDTDGKSIHRKRSRGSHEDEI